MSDEWWHQAIKSGLVNQRQINDAKQTEIQNLHNRVELLELEKTKSNAYYCSQIVTKNSEIKKLKQEKTKLQQEHDRYKNIILQITELIKKNGGITLSTSLPQNLSNRYII